ncbi:MAG: ABC transporter substrate-binding protein [Boseongicola sp. SB0664_bin_43]|uniref:ABC transporter substrate-binding protein n=1 Tax=Boseongicola sp. SB0664_bin_43 TaxID=2604844 RepID=A0A6B0Y0P3_9RHOB|nr:ABC transporter substrate-binding protein [Boseongicola sp. SB0664_bin_43]MYK33483.1 ABC transporter substrate-binding protein [Boseongicola sp. SB0670_bin_30]
MTMKIQILYAAALAIAPFGSAVQAQDKTVALANLGPHPALNAVIGGFKKGMADGGYAEGSEVAFEYQDASFDAAVVAQMIATLEASDPDLFLTVTTPISQAALRVVQDKSIPIVFAPVTDPVDAGLVPSWDGGSDRFTGASNLQSMETVFAFARDLLGDADTVGILFNPGDANDVVNVRYAERAAAEMGIELVTVSVEATADIPVRVDALKDTDVIYLIPSSMLQPALPAVAAAARRNGVPVINASPVGVEDGQILASMSVSWFEVGRQAGLRAARILDGEPVSAVDVYRPSPEDHSATISARYMEEFGMTLPDALADCGCTK